MFLHFVAKVLEHRRFEILAQMTCSISVIVPRVQQQENDLCCSWIANEWLGDGFFRNLAVGVARPACPVVVPINKLSVGIKDIRG
jgi:hypothetical protein